MTVAERELTRWQEKALDEIEGDNENARIVGWDAACGGPLVRLDGGFTVAISPRGKPIERNPA